MTTPFYHVVSSKCDVAVLIIYLVTDITDIDIVKNVGTTS